jgi:MFS family permease
LRRTEPVEKVQLSMRWRELFGLREYRSFLTGSLLFQVGFQFALPLFTIYTLRDLGASPLWVSLIVVSSSIAQIFTYPIWARWNDRYGWIKTMIWSIAIMSSSPFLYALTTTLWPLLLFNLVAGFGWAGYNLVSFNALLQTCPSGAREGGIAYYNMLMNGIAAVLPLVAVLISDWIGIRWALGMGAGLRMMGVVYFYLSIPSHRSHFPIRLRARSNR